MTTVRRRTTKNELHRYFSEWLETGFVNGLIDRNTRSATAQELEEWLPTILRDINQTGQCNIASKGIIISIFLREGLDPVSGAFNHFEIQLGSVHRNRKKLRCFVGHRFTEKLNRCIHSNLKYVLEPYGIDLVWSGMDMHAVGFFDSLLKQIKMCHFCIFDTRDTDKHPNVFIEAGIAYALKRPFILANYQKNRMGVPSDLTHILNIPYNNYKELTRQLYFKMPVFFKLTNLRHEK
jgi:hypothetical protein